MKTLGSALRALVVVLSVAGFVAGTVSAAGTGVFRQITLLRK